MKPFLNVLKNIAKIALGEAFFVKPDTVCMSERLGSEYGGWDIVTDDIGTDSVIYSFGIGQDASFDTALIEKYAATVHAFDPTPASIAWVKRQGFSERFIMHEYGIADFDGAASFTPPKNPDHISCTLMDRASANPNAMTVQIKKLRTIMKELGHDTIDILKMDIEGAEYDVINDICTSDVRPRQILVEFHHRFSGVGIKRTKEAIQRLRSIGYSLFSVSQRNEEFGFILKSNRSAALSSGNASGK